jgi:two-component system nitrogen regulation response regulator GlnG
MRVLLLDDDVGAAVVMTAMLELEGFDVRHVRTLSDARAELAASAFDVAALDCDLGDEWGPDLIPFVRAHHPALPVLVLSGRAGESEGADARFDKGRSPDELLEMLRALATRAGR